VASGADRDPQPQPRKRRLRRGALIALVVVLVVLIAGFVVVNDFGPAILTNYARQQVATALHLRSTAPVKVDLGSGSLVAELISGHIDELSISVNPISVDGLTGSVSATARDVPLDPSKSVRVLRIHLTVPTSTLTSKLASIQGLKSLHPKVTVAGSHVAIAGSVSIFGFRVPLALRIIPGVSKGRLAFTATTLTAGGITLPVADVDRYFPGLASALASGHLVCIATVLPSEFKLTGVALREQSLVYTLSGDGAELSSAALSHRGTCPGS
jgi:hypothetical protein